MEAGGGTKHQLFGNFLAFSESLHYLGPEKPLGARKSPKVAKWVTLHLVYIHEIQHTTEGFIPHCFHLKEIVL